MGISPEPTSMDMGVEKLNNDEVGTGGGIDTGVLTGNSGEVTS